MHNSLVFLPCTAEILWYSPSQFIASAIFLHRSCASSSNIKSTLLNTNQRGLPANLGLYFSNSVTIALALSTGSDPSAGIKSIRCNNTRQRSRCLRNWIPKPAPSDAPSIKPGISAITKLLMASKRTTPKLGTSVVNG